MPIKFPDKKGSARKDSEKGPSKKSIKQFASNVKLLTDMYLSDQDEVFEAPNLKNDESIDTFIEKIGEFVLVKDLNSLLKANGLKIGNLDKEKKLRSILMMNVEENAKKEGKDKKDKTNKSDSE